MRIYIIGSILFILGLLSITWQQSEIIPTWIKPYCDEFSSALIVGGLLSLLFKIFQDKQSENNLKRFLRIHDSVDDCGLQEIVKEAQSYSFSSIIENSKKLSIIMNDGLRWTGNNTVSLQKRLSTNNTITEMFTVDPDSDFVNCLAQKTSIDKIDVQKKIKETWKRLDEIYNSSDKKGQMTIFKLKTYPTKSLFISEDICIETPYQISSGRVKIPVIVYRKVDRSDSLYNFIYNDYEAIKSEAIVSKEYLKSK